MIFWTKSPTNDTLSPFNWSRDYIYIGNVLLGIGGAMTVVIGLSRISFLVGKFKVSTVDNNHFGYCCLTTTKQQLSRLCSAHN